MTSDTIYQLKITLSEIRPPVWRRVLVPSDFTLEMLHDIIQAIMPWEESHLYLFERGQTQYGPPMLQDDLDEIKDDDVEIGKVLTAPHHKMRYIYDFGDNWSHLIELEKILEGDPETDYPVCIAGKRACPPEDCGGPPGYAEMLKAIKDSSHPEHQMWVEWVGEDFDPDAFDLEEANAMLQDVMAQMRPAVGTLNRHAIILKPTKALKKLYAKRVKPKEDEHSLGLRDYAFLISLTDSEQEFLQYVDVMFPVLAVMHLVTSGFEPEVIGKMENNFHKYYEVETYPWLLDLDANVPLMHLLREPDE